MNPEYAAYFEALELTPDAAPEDIKKAYFRLVRKFPPEKEPERFKIIRQAYEALKDGLPPEEEDFGFQPPEAPAVRDLAESALRDMRSGDFKAASAGFEKALALAPDNRWLLLHLAQSQNRADHPRKAIRTASRLSELAPACREAYTIMASGMCQCGWHKKALPMFRKAFALGETGAAFLSAYAQTAVSNDQIDEAVEISGKTLQLIKWNKANIEYAYTAYCNLAAYDMRTVEDVLRLLDSYEAFLLEYKRLHESGVMIISPLMAAHSEQPEFMANPAIYRREDALLQTAIRVNPDGKQAITLFRNEILPAAMRADGRILHTEWSFLAAVPLYDRMNQDPKMTRFAELDAQLCLLKDAAIARKDIALIKSDYPHFYEQNRDFIDRMAAGDSSDPDDWFIKLKREFFRLSDKFDGSEFLRRYPEERPRVYNAVRIHDSARPFARGGQKIGRNDPCPCGSGKKFKRCCLGKGIYD